MGAVPSRVALAIVASALVSIVALALVDPILTIPSGTLAASLTDSLRLFALSARGYVTMLWPFVVLHGVLALTWIISARRPRWRHAFAPAIALACGFKSYAILVGYPRFVGYLPFIIAWLGLTAFLVVAYLCPVSARRRLRIAVIAIGVLGMIAAQWANVTVFSGTYPTFHRALSSVAYLLLHVTLLHLVVRRAAPLHSSLRGWALVLGGTALVGLGSLAAASSSNHSVRAYRTFTLIGQSEIATAVPWQGTCSKRPTPMHERDALEIFARWSGMPVLPESFRLTDFNVLLITIDTLRFDDTSFGGRTDLTPNLARVAADRSFVFSDLMAPSNQTLQSTLSLLTGTYPSHVPMITGAPTWTGVLRDGAQTMIDTLRESDIYTFAALHALMPGVTSSLEHRFHKVYQLRDIEDPLADETTASSAVEELTALASAQRRFFGWVFFIAPHWPYPDRQPPTPRARDRYRQNVAYVDHQVGRLYDHLAAIGLLDRTVVIILGDHGEEFLDHFSTGHAHTLYRELLHVPALVRIPGNAGGLVSHPTSATYLIPWLLVSEPGPSGEAARRTIRDDLAPMLEATDGAVVAEVIGWDRMMTALIWNEHKIMYNLFSGFTEIFARKTDPEERTNLADLPTSLRIKLLSKLDAYLGLRACSQRVQVTDQDLIQ